MPPSEVATGCNTRVSLKHALESALPRDSQSTIRYVRSRRQQCEPLYSPYPGVAEGKTTQTSHFLTVCTPAKQQDILAYAVEVLIYSTGTLTTLFVSKADSTGYRSEHHPVPIRDVTTAFLRWLIDIETLRRPQRPLVVSLFGRAQGTYLFPGSTDHGKKHVLDDRQLIKWWVKVVNPLLRPGAAHTSTTCQGYITVPGYQGVELRSFLPPERMQWTAGNPLQSIARLRGLPDHAPTRSLLPRFPDDPKARFMQDLDDEVGLHEDAGALAVLSPRKRKDGRWKTIQSLDRFWEAMEFRQECSSGRVVGFLWLTINMDTTPTSKSRQQSPSRDTVIRTRDRANSAAKRPRKKKNKPLKGPIRLRAPKVKGSSQRRAGDQPFDADGVILASEGYDQMMQTLLHLDCSSPELATISTQKWIREIATICRIPPGSWTLDVRGTLDTLHQHQRAAAGSAVNDLGSIVRKKKRPADEATTVIGVETGAASTPATNILGAGLVRKKVKAV